MEQDKSALNEILSALDEFSEVWTSQQVLESFLSKNQNADVISKGKLRFWALDSLPNPEFYYAIGLISKPMFDVLQNEWRHVFLNNAWNYVTNECHPDSLTEKAQLIWYTLDTWHSDPENFSTDAISWDDLRCLGIPETQIQDFCPNWEDLCDSFTSRDFRDNIPVLKFFTPDVLDAMERIRDVVGLFAKYREGSDDDMRLFDLEISKKGVSDDNYEKQFWRLETLANVFNHLVGVLPYPSPVLTDIYASMSDIYSHFCARELDGLRTMPIPADHPEVAERMGMMIDYFQQAIGKPIDEATFEREITTAVLNGRYIVAKISDETAVKDSLQWYDACMMLTPAEKQQYENWEEQRRAAGLLCFEPGDGVMAVNDVALSEEAQKRYKANLSAAWEALQVEHIFDIQKNQTTVLIDGVEQPVIKLSLKGQPEAVAEAEADTEAVPEELSTLEWRLGEAKYSVTALHWLYLLGVLTEMQSAHTQYVERNWFENPKSGISPLDMTAKEAVESIRRWAMAPLSVPQPQKVTAVLERWMLAVQLYGERFCEDADEFSVTLWNGEVPNRLGNLDSLHLDGALSEGKALSGLVAICNGLDPEQKHTGIQNGLNVLIHNFYSTSLSDLSVLSMYMPPRQQSQMQIALTALSQFEDTSVHLAQKGPYYAQLLNDIRTLVFNTYSDEPAKRNAALSTFNKWVYPLQMYWCSTNHIRRNTGHGGDRGEDGCITR